MRRASKRPYRLKKRARLQDETRRRIVEAAVSLHEEVGPAATSISGIARRAGVQRLTVYRHFPDEAAIFDACSSHWLAQHPPPDPRRWEREKDPSARVRLALTLIYAYFRQTESMMRSIHRDYEALEALRSLMDERFFPYFHGVAQELVRGWGASREERSEARAVLSHALRFSTWDSLSASGLSDQRMAELITRWLSGLGSGGGSKRRRAAEPAPRT